ncbi:MAG: hypothetical protein KJZ78_11620, partial [Bryobacteraceae bacterium]|nr:hypothetical protein [Bryobacteraceae bacterium]
MSVSWTSNVDLDDVHHTEKRARRRAWFQPGATDIIERFAVPPAAQVSRVLRCPPILPSRNAWSRTSTVFEEQNSPTRTAHATH